MTSKLGKYELLRTLGRGAYSKVKLAKDSETGEYVAIKIHKSEMPDFTLDIRAIVETEVRTIA